MTERLKLKFNFNPFKEGLNQVLGALEKDIMEIMWKRGEACVKNILDSFPLHREISYSTIITVTNRMTKKGLLNKRKQGKAYFYKPTYSREQFLEVVSKKIVEGVSEFSFQSAIANFVDYMSLVDPNKLEYFSQLIKSKKRVLSSPEHVGDITK